MRSHPLWLLSLLILTLTDLHTVDQAMLKFSIFAAGGAVPSGRVVFGGTGAPGNLSAAHVQSLLTRIEDPATGFEWPLWTPEIEAKTQRIHPYLTPEIMASVEMLLVEQSQSTTGAHD